MPTEEKLNLLRSVLQSPLFHQILALQKSVQHLRDQVSTGSSHQSAAFSLLPPPQFSLLTVPSMLIRRCNVVNLLLGREIVCITCVQPPFH